MLYRRCFVGSRWWGLDSNVLTFLQNCKANAAQNANRASKGPVRSKQRVRTGRTATSGRLHTAAVRRPGRSPALGVGFRGSRSPTDGPRRPRRGALFVTQYLPLPFFAFAQKPTGASRARDQRRHKAGRRSGPGGERAAPRRHPWSPGAAGPLARGRSETPSPQAPLPAPPRARDHQQRRGRVTREAPPPGAAGARGADVALTWPGRRRLLPARAATRRRERGAGWPGPRSPGPLPARPAAPAPRMRVYIRSGRGTPRSGRAQAAGAGAAPGGEGHARPPARPPGEGRGARGRPGVAPRAPTAPAPAGEPPRARFPFAEMPPGSAPQPGAGWGSPSGCGGLTWMWGGLGPAGPCASSGASVGTCRLQRPGPSGPGEGGPPPPQTPPRGPPARPPHADPPAWTPPRGLTFVDPPARPPCVDPPARRGAERSGLRVGGCTGRWGGRGWRPRVSPGSGPRAHVWESGSGRVPSAARSPRTCRGGILVRAQGFTGSRRQFLCPPDCEFGSVSWD
uniref:translation initiation factor IF-2-like n=1 Tax=Nyctereutes procyonoides TaxID=34880 RepID=UPI002443B938|nr:translation initiation factor IF-2-like [Nyctereutes procyonoides]